MRGSSGVAELMEVVDNNKIYSESWTAIAEVSSGAEVGINHICFVYRTGSFITIVYWLGAEQSETVGRRFDRKVRKITSGESPSLRRRLSSP